MIYHGPDAVHRGRELCFNSAAPNTNPNSNPNSNHRVTIVDVTDKAAVVKLGEQNYPQQGYSHQAWLTPHHDILLHGDELDETSRGVTTRTRIWDVRDLYFRRQNIVAVASIDRGFFVLSPKLNRSAD